MSEYLLDRETLLDIIVNIVPLVIIAFFFALFSISSQSLGDPLIVFVSLVLLVVPFIILALVTYISGWLIERDEKEQGTTKQDAERQNTDRTHRGRDT